MENKRFKMEKKHVLFTREASVWFKWLAVVIVILSHYAEWWAWFATGEGPGEAIRLGLSRMGPYGVAIFLLFSGYGLTKSAGEERISTQFILKRIIHIYIPYLAMVLLIEGFSGGIQSWEALSDIWYGQNFWYMTVLFSFYLAFMAIWLVFANRHIRMILMILFTFTYSCYLFITGHQDFWYVSNMAFAIGTALALYERKILNLNITKWSMAAALLGACSAYAGYVDLCGVHNGKGTMVEIGSRIGAVIIFTFFIVFVASIWKVHDPVGRFLGKCSMYFYLSHTFLFMWVVNAVTYNMGMRFLTAAIVTIIVSVFLGEVFTRLTDVFYQKVQTVVDFKRKKG